MSSTKGNIFFLLSMLYITFILTPLIIILEIFFPWFSNDYIAIYYILTSILMLVFPMIIYFAISGNPINEVLSIKGISIKNIFLIIIFSITIQPFTALISYLSTFFYDNVAEQTISSLMDTNFFVGIIAIALAPAIIEEFFMRGVFQWNYRKVKPKYVFLINGLMFGILHQNLQQFFYAFLIGVFFSIFVYYTGSILAGIIGHFTINGSQFALGYFMSKSDYNELENTPFSAIEIISTATLIIFSLIICAGAFYIFYKNNIKNKKDPYMEYDSPFDSSFFITFGTTFGILVFQAVLIGLMAFFQ